MNITFSYGENEGDIVQTEDETGRTLLHPSNMSYEENLADQLAAHRNFFYINQITMPDGEVIDCSNEPVEEEVTVVEPEAIEE